MKNAQTATTENTNDTRVSVPVNAARALIPTLAPVASAQHALDAMPRTADKLRALADEFVANVDAIEALVMLARDGLRSQKESDATIIGEERMAQCLAAIAEYRMLDNEDTDTRSLLHDRIVVLYAAITPWIRSGGREMRDSLTGETRVRGADEVAALKLGKRLGAVALKTTPFHLPQSKREAVAAFQQAKADARAKRLAGVTGKVIEAAQ